MGILTQRIQLCVIKTFIPSVKLFLIGSIVVSVLPFPAYREVVIVQRLIPVVVLIESIIVLAVDVLTIEFYLEIIYVVICLAVFRSK